MFGCLSCDEVCPATRRENQMNRAVLPADPTQTNAGQKESHPENQGHVLSPFQSSTKGRRLIVQPRGILPRHLNARRKTKPDRESAVMIQASLAFATAWVRNRCAFRESLVRDTRSRRSDSMLCRETASQFAIGGQAKDVRPERRELRLYPTRQ